MKSRSPERLEALLRVARKATPEDPAEVPDLAAALLMSGASLHKHIQRAVREGYLVRLRPGVFVRGPRA